MLYPVILAGGSGTRLWPVSTQNNPKQVKALLGGETLFQATYQRLLSGFKADDIFVVTTKNLEEAIKQQISMDADHIFIEPQLKGTAIAIGLAAINLLVKDPAANLVIINSDQFIKEIPEYLEAIKQAGQLADAQPEQFILLGIKPQYPETGYGYIHLASETINKIGKYDVYRVEQFKEKPDKATAEKYIKAGDYLWNPAIFIFNAKSLIQWYQKFLPEIYQVLNQAQQALTDNDQEKYQQILTAGYQKIKTNSIDYGLLEKLDKMLCLPVDLTWADIGHWRSLRDVQLIDKVSDNITNSQEIGLDSRRNLLYSTNGKLIATIGVEDMILVETEKVILLCPADRAQEVKDLLDKFGDKLANYL